MDKTILAFCSSEQVETNQALEIDGNGDFLLNCPCGRFLKFPGSMSASEIKDALAEHKSENEGKINMAELEAKKESILEEIGVVTEAVDAEVLPQ